ncbi:MAG TPA: DNA topoisomerase IV subunit A [Phycisphaerae bacterium]|nr:DNA topoisomerase IV subunit A [Phycisphaerae bacterium]HOJ73202.1 DNA topoisomerase IV subunit A [Phycisphaerae bacterium]HOM51232.1 DNA topoisomerase IV subunit A [Phycisphaerae bacterium]HPP25360.1 DNA topoisomerase IV subunit A [Phycisphaerae bacterium]HPU24663.1 DNA topoisomerase IV subunit A [Phycisphaerae bacterium]
MAKKAAKRSSAESKVAAASGGRRSALATAKAKETTRKLEGLAESIARAASKKMTPKLEIPIRALSNVKFNPKRAIIEMGENKQSRAFFDLNMAKKFMQTALVAAQCKQLIEEGKTASIRQLYYRSKHDVAGTKEKTFNSQEESDPIIEDLEVTIDALREELHVFASNRGSLVGPITLVDDGNTLDCMKMGSAGYPVPSIVEPDVIQFKKCSAKFILHVEKDTVWRRFYEDRFHETHNCIVTHGGGQPARGMRRLLRRMHDELKLPVYCLLDCDPWGYYIYSVIKQGSISLAYESQRMAVPQAMFIGVSSFDYDRFGLSDDVKIGLDDNDIRRAKQILNYPWFKGKKHWEKEIRKMMQNGFKMEVEALTTKRLTYLAEEYVPAKLKDKKQWLD